jgi:hypothetical protein
MDPQMMNSLIYLLGSVGGQMGEANDNPMAAAMGKSAAQYGQMGSFINAKDKAAKQQSEWLTQLLGGGGKLSVDGKGMKIDVPHQAGSPLAPAAPATPAAPAPAPAPAAPPPPSPGASLGGGMDVSNLISGLMRPFLLGQRI